MKTAIIKAEVGGIIEAGQNYGIVSKFEVHLKYNLSSYLFHVADTAWLHCIAAHRKKNFVLKRQK